MNYCPQATVVFRESCMRIKQSLVILVCGFTLGVGAANAQVVIHRAPPPVIVERAGPPLHAGWVWMPGYYRWYGGRYVWVPGRWVSPPRPRALWGPGRWVPR